MTFISVLEVIESIEAHVPMPKDWKEGVLSDADVPLPSILSGVANVVAKHNKLKIDLLNGFSRSVFRCSQAAGALEFFLHEAAEHGPTWRDHGQTGWPKAMGDAARLEAIDMLVHMATWYNRYEKAYRSSRFNGWPRSIGIQDHEGKFKSHSDAERLRLIGFERGELIEFLNKFEIPHSLSNMQSDPSVLQTTLDNVPCDISDKPDCVESANEDLSNSTQREKADNVMPDGTIHYTGGRQRYYFADEIEEAQRKVGNSPNNARTVYAELRKMTETGNYPRLISFDEKQGIKYLASGGVYKFYTQDALRKYLNPAARGKKNKKIKS